MASSSAYSQNNINNSNHLDNAHSLSLLILVIMVVSSAQHLFAKIPSFANSEYPTGIMAVLAGTIVSLIVFLPVKYLYAGPTGMSNNQVISLSVLMGIIVSYFMVFEIRPGLPSISALALMVFMFYHHIDMLPDSHAKV
jgi:uncharacterized membrane protein